MSEPMQWGARDEPLASRPVPVTDPAAYPPAYGPPHRRRIWPVVAITAAATALAFAAAVAVVARTGSHPTASPASPTTVAPILEPFKASGTLLLTASTSVLNLDNLTCQGMDDYRDLAPGAQVVITDERHTTVATGQLTTGFLVGSGMTRQCRFGWSAPAVPPGHPFYAVTVAGRAGPQVTEADLKSGGLELTIG